MGLKGRVLCLFLICFIVNSGVLIGFNVYSSRQNAEALQHVAHDLQQLRIVGSMERTFGEVIQAWKNILLRGHDPKLAQKHEAELDAREKTIQSLIVEFRNSDDIHHFEAPLTEFADAFGIMMQNYRKAQKDFLQRQAWNPTAADAAVRGIDRKVLDGVSKIVKLVEERANANENSSTAANNWSMQLSAWSSLVCGLAFFLIFSHFLKRIIQSLNTMTQTLSGSSHEVAEASTLIAHSATELSTSVTEQASTMQEMVATIDEISAMVQRNTEATQESLRMATASETLARRGSDSVQQMVASFHDISQSYAAIAEAMTRSHDDIGRIIVLIGEIGNQTRVINDIVFQTRLLSFNASVEAARAGEHGKGFAVVAEEVGKLAQMSGRASKEISANLEHTHQQVQDIVTRTRETVHELMGHGQTKMEAGRTLAGNCGQILIQITESFTAVHQKITEIATASWEQNRGIQEITRAIAQLEDASHQNATVAEQCSSASEQLHDESAAMKSLVADLLQTIGTQTQKKPEAKSGVHEADAEPDDEAMPEAA